PASLASAAFIGRPITSSEKARAWPMRRGASRLAAASGTRPRLTNGVEKRASELATTWSQCRSMVVPTPTALPATAATSGLLQRASTCRNRTIGSPSPPVPLAMATKSCRSFPAVKAPGAPANTRQRIDSRAPASSMASAMAVYIASVRALRFSGRFMRTVRMASSSVTLMRSVIDSAFPTRIHGPDIDQGIAAHDVIGVVQINGRIAVRRDACDARTDRRLRRTDRQDQLAMLVAEELIAAVGRRARRDLRHRAVGGEALEPRIGRDIARRVRAHDRGRYEE